ncbi:MAG: aldo/keto reductase [Thermostichales cyanobacterium BF3_bins_165]
MAERIRLGTTSLEVSPLGLGTWAWGDRLFWGYGQGYRDPDLEGAFRVSLELGVTFLDTAEIYGNGYSEQLIGQFSRGCREQVQIATKIMPFPWRLGSQATRQALLASLKRLAIPQVDLYQIHWPLPPMAIEVWMEWLVPLVQQGLTRAVGVSNYSASQLRRAHQALAQYGIPLASNQVHYSLLHRDPEANGVLQACRELGVTLIAYSPLGMGLLTGKYSEEQVPPGPRGWQAAATLRKKAPLLQRLRQLAEQYGKTPAQVALNWLLCQGVVPIPGAKNARQAQENAGALGWRLTPEDVHSLGLLA